MASVMRLAAGALTSGLHQAANLASAPLRLLSVPRLAAAYPSRHTIATLGARHHPSTASSAPSSSSLSSSIPAFTTSLLLQRIRTAGPAVGVQNCRSYHVRVALKRRCSSCYFVRRKGRLFVECKAKPRHKQMQVMSKRKTWKEDYSKGAVQRAVHWKYNRDYRYYKLGDTPFVRHDWLKGKIGVTV